MSVRNLFKDFFTGNYENAGARLKDWWAGVSPAVQTFLHKIESDEGKILEGLAAEAAQDVISGGLTTASFVAAFKDVGAKLLAQNITMGKQDIAIAVNTAVSYLTPAQNPLPASVDPTSSYAPLAAAAPAVASPAAVPSAAGDSAPVVEPVAVVEPEAAEPASGLKFENTYPS